MCWRVAHFRPTNQKVGSSSPPGRATFHNKNAVFTESYAQQGKHKEGFDELQKAADLSGDSPLYMAQVGVSLGLAGEKKEALRVIRELQGISGKRYVSPDGLAQIYATLKIKSSPTSGLRLPIVIVLSGCRISPWIRCLIRFARKSASGIYFAVSACLREHLILSKSRTVFPAASPDVGLPAAYSNNGLKS